MRTSFDQQLEALNTGLIEMGGLIENAISLASAALMEKNVDKAAEATRCDHEVDEKERELEALCLKLLLQQQPVARDLRFISSALKMITDMERIGDQAADIAEITRHLAGAPDIHQYPHIPRMAQSAITMLKGAIDAFVRRDLALAQSAIRMDDVVDDLFEQIRCEIIELIHRDPTLGEQAIDLMMVAKYFERIGDHAENIADWVVFSITGEHLHTQGRQ